jgi:aspartate/methionine/tyrosine aminotransferase
MISAIENGKTHYTEAKGLYEFRKKIAEHYNDLFNPDEIIISSGLKEALYVLLLSLDTKTVCVLEPAWLGYQATCILAEKEYKPISLYDDLWIERLAETEFDTLLICSPNNPDGKVFDESTIRVIKSIVEQKDAYLIIDEIYNQYMYIDNISGNVKYLYDYPKVIIANGLSKSHAMTGIRIGYLLTHCSDLMTRMILVQQNLSTCPTSIGQYAGVNFIDALVEVKNFHEYYKINRSIVVEMIPELKQFIPDGGFYYFFDLKKFGRSNGDLFCNEILETEKRALVPGSAYGQSFEDWVRLSFSVEREYLKVALVKLNNFLKTSNVG